MNAKVKQLFKAEPKPVEPEICTVVRAEKGKALEIAVPSQKAPMTVAGHRAGVTMLGVGDQVMITHTTSGPVIIERLLKEDEAPAPLFRNEDGKLVLESGKGIRLVCGEACVEITENGKVRIDGREVSTFSSGRVRVQGVTIELN